MSLLTEATTILARRIAQADLDGQPYGDLRTALVAVLNHETIQAYRGVVFERDTDVDTHLRAIALTRADRLVAERKDELVARRGAVTLAPVTATAIATQIADLAEELRSLPVDNVIDILIALSRATSHIADFVAAAPAHYPHVTARAAKHIHDSAGALELALDAELNPCPAEPVSVGAGVKLGVEGELGFRDEQADYDG